MIALSVAKLKMFSPESKIFFWIKPKKKNKLFEKSFDQCLREKTRNAFCEVLTFVWPQGVTQHRIFIKFFSISLGFYSFFSLVFRASNFWSLRNLIKQLFHSRMLDMRLVIANSALRASLAIYHPTRTHGIIVNYFMDSKFKALYALHRKLEGWTLNLLQTCFYLLVVFSLTGYQRIELSFGSANKRITHKQNLLIFCEQRASQANVRPKIPHPSIAKCLTCTITCGSPRLWNDHDRESGALK